MADEILGERRQVDHQAEGVQYSNYTRQVYHEAEGGEPHQQSQLHLQGERPLQRSPPQVGQKINLC